MYFDRWRMFMVWLFFLAFWKGKTMSNRNKDQLSPRVGALGRGWQQGERPHKEILVWLNHFYDTLEENTWLHFFLKPIELYMEGCRKMYAENLKIWACCGSPERNVNCDKGIFCTCTVYLHQRRYVKRRWPNDFGKVCADCIL